MKDLKAALERIKALESPAIPESNRSWDDNPNTPVTDTLCNQWERQREKHDREIAEAEQVLRGVCKRIRRSDEARALQQEKDDHWRHQTY